MVAACTKPLPLGAHESFWISLAFGESWLCSPSSDLVEGTLIPTAIFLVLWWRRATNGTHCSAKRKSRSCGRGTRRPGRQTVTLMLSQRAAASIRCCKPSSGDPTSTAKRRMDAPVGLRATDTRLNPDNEVVEEEVELDEDLEPVTGSFGGVWSQGLFVTPQGSSQSQPCSSGMQDAGEGSSDVTFIAQPPTPAECLRLLRKQPLRNKEEMFQEHLRSSETAKREKRT